MQLTWATAAPPAPLGSQPEQHSAVHSSCTCPAAISPWRQRTKSRVSLGQLTRPLAARPAGQRAVPVRGSARGSTWGEGVGSACCPQEPQPTCAARPAPPAPSPSAGPNQSAGTVAPPTARPRPDTHPVGRWTVCARRMAVTSDGTCTAPASPLGQLQPISAQLMRPSGNQARGQPDRAPPAAFAPVRATLHPRVGTHQAGGLGGPKQGHLEIS